MARRRFHSVRSIKRSSRLRRKATVKNVPEPNRYTEAEIDISDRDEDSVFVSTPANDNDDPDLCEAEV
jgi:hypothetical protein